jgi:dipeptidyl aminopeptidase/acylaminoacyl peptidase
MAHPRIAALPEARGFVAVSADGGAVVRGELAQGTLTASSGGHDRITDIAWSPDGRAIASVARDGTCVVWDAATGAPCARIKGPRSGRELELAWCPDGRAIVVVEQSGVVACWNVHDSTPAWRIGVRPPRPLESPSKWRAAVSPDGEFLAVRSNALRVYRVGDPTPVLERTDAAYFAWHADHPAVLVTVTRLATPETRWEALDLRDAKPRASGAVRARIATLALDGRHLWSQASLPTQGDGLTAFAIDPIAPQRLSFQSSVRGMITAHGGVLLATADGGAIWVVRVDGSARPAPPSIDEFPRHALSPDGTRLAMARNGRVAIVALP